MRPIRNQIGLLASLEAPFFTDSRPHRNAVPGHAFRGPPRAERHKRLADDLARAKTSEDKKRGIERFAVDFVEHGRVCRLPVKMPLFMHW